ncbi:amino acid-binding protein [Bacteroidia bacterium]|nr:amino acid-binding protein [Bacteroidia bacterium]GHT57103.1 amino acid-binding protein [Bacteroidia bacterium]
MNQISIFLENKYGRLNEILSFLAASKVRVIAATVADTSDYGILRLITSNQQETCSLLKENGVSASLSPVLVIATAPDTASFAETIAHFTKAGIDIDYMYCFSLGEKVAIVLRTKNTDAAHDVVRKNGLDYIDESDLI